MKHLYKKSYFNRRNFILSELEILDITCEECVVLLCIDYNNEFQILFDLEVMSKKCKLTPNKIDEILNSLVNKGYLEINMNNRQIEYVIDNVFKVKEDLEVLTTNEYRSLFDLYEEEFARPLTSREAERLSEWMSIYDLKLIEYALREAIVYEKRSFDYVNAILISWKEKELTVIDYEEGKR